MTKNSCAVAVFVKTPGLSPVKTRLGQTLGEKKATEIYHFSVAAIQELLQKASTQLTFTPFWAVAEEAGLSNFLWKHFERIYQGEGQLGDRLNCIYSQLKKDFSKVILIGVDCPQMGVEDFMTTVVKLSQSPFVIGKSLDGGFYLFGGQSEIPSEVWKSVPYSVSETADRLIQQLAPYGKIDNLSVRFDIDTESDLRLLAKHPLQGLFPSQQNVVLWARQLT